MPSLLNPSLDNCIAAVHVVRTNPKTRPANPPTSRQCPLKEVMMVDQSAIEGFKASLRGPLLQPADPDYGEARKVWNSMIDKCPALIARCAGVADVIQCVNFARANNLLVSVRGGGHNIGGNAVCDGGLTIDLSRMQGLRVDPSRPLARAEPGLTWRVFASETHAFGLAPTGAPILTAA